MKERRKIQNENEEIFRVLFHLFGDFVIIFTDRANNTYRSIHRMQMQNGKKRKKHFDHSQQIGWLFHHWVDFITVTFCTDKIK